MDIKNIRELPFLIIEPEELDYTQPQWDLTKSSGGTDKWHDLKRKMSGRATEASVDVALVTYDSHRLYCHFIEWAACFYAAKSWLFPNGAVREIILGCADGDWSRQGGGIGVQNKMLKILFPKAKIIEDFDARPSCEKVLYYQRMMAYGGFGKCLDTLRYFPSDIFSEFRDKVFTHLKLESKPVDRSKIVYARRTKGSQSMSFHDRVFTENAERRLLDFLGRKGEVQVVDFGDMTWEEQVALSNQCGTLVGLHGNNLTNGIFLPKGSIVLELFPEGTYNSFYQVMFEIFGINWVGVNDEQIFVKGFRTPWGLLGKPNSTCTKINVSLLEKVYDGLLGLWFDQV